MIASLRHNFWYKMLAVLFAVVLHVYAAGLINARPSHTLILPLKVRNLPPTLILDDKTLPSVTLTLDGSSDDINRLSETVITASVDLSHARAGQTPPLPVRLTGLPPEITVQSDPHPVSLMLEPRRRRQIPISAGDVGIPEASYSLSKPVVLPRVAIITGTQEAVDAVDRLVAQPDPDPIAGPVDEDYVVMALDSSGSPVGNVTVTPPTVHVRREQARALSRKTLVVSANVVGTPPPPYRFGNIAVSPATLTAEGPPAKLEAIGTLTTQPIDVSGARADVVQKAALILPPGVTLSPSGPVTVTVHVIAPPLSEPPAASP